MEWGLFQPAEYFCWLSQHLAAPTAWAWAAMWLSVVPPQRALTPLYPRSLPNQTHTDTDESQIILPQAAISSALSHPNILQTYTYVSGGGVIATSLPRLAPACRCVKGKSLLLSAPATRAFCWPSS